ncbi:hypothetical protein M758_UG320200 [Ceratodon purpureus]|nr:hypothetical protein M758_UG320200 [Ceratodon purpureus]
MLETAGAVRKTKLYGALELVSVFSIRVWVLVSWLWRNLLGFHDLVLRRESESEDERRGCGEAAGRGARLPREALVLVRHLLRGQARDYGRQCDSGLVHAGTGVVSWKAISTSITFTTKASPGYYGLTFSLPRWQMFGGGEGVGRVFANAWGE